MDMLWLLQISTYQSCLLCSQELPVFLQLQLTFYPKENDFN